MKDDQKGAQKGAEENDEEEEEEEEEEYLYYQVAPIFTYQEHCSVVKSVSPFRPL